MEFKAEVDGNGNIDVKPMIEKKGKNVIIHLPSLPLIQKLKKDKQNDKRNIQQI